MEVAKRRIVLAKDIKVPEEEWKKVLSEIAKIPRLEKELRDKTDELN